MRSINIILHFKNMKYAEDLARGLCYEYTGLNIFLASKEEIPDLLENGILLTDILDFVSPKTLLFDDKNKSSIHCITKTSSIREIMAEIKRLVFREYGNVFYKTDPKVKVIGVFSKRGGLGVTSFAIALARLIAAKTEENVLFLNLGILDDYDIYTGIHEHRTLSKRQYIFLKQEGIETNIEDYCEKDSWGVMYFKPETYENTFFDVIKPEQIIKYITEENYFSYIIVDYGKRNKINDETTDIKIEIFDDSILCYETGKDLSKEYLFVRDKTSFSIDDNKIYISMKGSYAHHIEQFLDQSELLF